MSFSRYAEYRDSGVEWLGVVPAHWTVEPCRAVFTERSERNDPLVNEDYLSLMANVGVIPYAEKGDVGNKKPEDLTKCKLVFAGDLVINSMNYGIGSYGLSSYTGVCSPVYIVLKPRLERIEERFAFRILENKAFQGFAQSHGNGILEHRAAINWDILKGIGVPLPPVLEQKAILQFLDHETAKIDALVAEQEKLITLLQEKRQAVISHAVTKGLNPNVPMKDSGVEWLGEVPEHWEVRPLRYCVDFQEGPGILADDFRDGGVPLIRVAGVQSKWATLEGCNYLDPEKVARRWQHFRVSIGDLLVSASASMGTISEVGPQVEGAIPYTGIIRMRGRGGEMIKDFLRHVFVSCLFLTQIDLLKAGATIQHYGPTHLSQMFVLRPPVSEQRVIAEFIDQELERFDELSSKAERIVALLQERRTALISAAVTGQIDVRGWVPADAASNS